MCSMFVALEENPLLVPFPVPETTKLKRRKVSVFRTFWNRANVGSYSRFNPKLQSIPLGEMRRIH
jgi:hypothetical protein